MNEFEELYRSGGYRLSEFERDEYWARVLREVQVINGLGRGLRILDVGCGKGEVSRFLRTDHGVYGLDMSWTAAREARRFLSWVSVGDVFRIPFGDCSFDLVIMFETLYYSGLTNRPRTLEAFAEIRRVLKPGGAFILGNGVANDPAFWFPEIKVWLLRRMSPRILAFAQRLARRPPKASRSYSRYVLTIGEIRERLTAAGFRVEAFYPYEFYVPLLIRNERFLPILFKLGEFYPMLARYGLFMARCDSK